MLYTQKGSVPANSCVNGFAKIRVLNSNQTLDYLQEAPIHSVLTSTIIKYIYKIKQIMRSITNERTNKRLQFTWPINILKPLE